MIKTELFESIAANVLKPEYCYLATFSC